MFSGQKINLLYMNCIYYFTLFITTRKEGTSLFTIISPNYRIMFEFKSIFKRNYQKSVNFIHQTMLELLKIV